MDLTAGYTIDLFKIIKEYIYEGSEAIWKWEDRSSGQTNPEWSHYSIETFNIAYTVCGSNRLKELAVIAWREK